MEYDRYKTSLKMAGLRPTQQRIALCALIFGRGERHFTVNQLFDEAISEGISVSLATVYNTLNLLAKFGKLRPLTVQGSETYFDTNVSAHHHYQIEGSVTIHDFYGDLTLRDMSALPDSHDIVRIDVMVHLRRT